MRVVTVSRKRCYEGTTTKNVLSFHAGALNIDRTRVKTDDVVTNHSRSAQAAKSKGKFGDSKAQDTHQTPGQKLGRWPANLVLQHRPGCEQVGTSVVPGYTVNRWSDGAKPFGGGAGHEYESEKQPDEAVAVWSCAPGCAVYHLGLQSGVTTSGAMKREVDAYEGTSVTGFLRGKSGPHNQRADTGTAARFFKQVKIMDESIPEELMSYLATMISPPPSLDPLVVVELDLKSNHDFSGYDDSSVHGMIVQGDPGPYMEEIDRILRPGAHLLVVAPDDQPSGHTGACSVEDFGYEIRDAILVLDDDRGFHYVPKPSQNERNAGVEVRVNKHGKEVQNDHVTVKPVGVMEALLRDVPPGLVVDAFMGSGTTGIACLRTGHDFVGVDMEREHVVIADQRLRHWNSNLSSWDSAEIESDVASGDEEDDEPMGLGELFGM